MLQHVLTGIAALRLAYIADNAAADEALHAAAWAAVDALDIPDANKAHMRKPGPMRLFNAAIWCMRNGSTSIVAGWAGAGLPNADKFDPFMAEQIDAALAGN